MTTMSYNLFNRTSKDAMQQQLDTYTLLAARLNEINYKDVTPSMRADAKAKARAYVFAYTGGLTE